MKQYIDTHVHLYDDAYDKDFDAVVDRIKKSGVIKCILPGIDSSCFKKQEACAQKCGPLVAQGIGLHPTSVGANWREELDFALEKLYNGNTSCPDKKYVTVGEIGLDGYWSKEFLEQQKLVFKEQLLASVELDLPVIIHLREATNEVFDVFDKLKEVKLRGVFHAYSGSYETFERIMSYGDFMVGIGGVITYKNAGIAKALERIPLDKVLLETDAPWLTPVPFRGKRNESAYVEYIAKEVAKIKGCSLDEVAETTTCNAKNMFGINDSI